MNKEVTMVVPTISKDIEKILKNIDIYFYMLPINRICIIGNENLNTILPEDKRLIFINEDMLIDYNKIKNQIINKTGKVEAGKRTGWYVQQFIKMKYSRICDEDYYLLWDSDTIPVKTVKLFNENELPYLDCKTEYHKPYFDTISKLLPGYEKMIKGSFIAEHMLINTNMMKSLLDDIECNEKIEGIDFTEKIINAISVEDLPHSGFSEFETYGTYVGKKYSGIYQLRNWKSLRFGGLYFDGAKALRKQDIEWISSYYDAVSFETNDYISVAKKIVPFIEKVGSPKALDRISVLIRAFRRLKGKR